MMRRMEIGSFYEQEDVHRKWFQDGVGNAESKKTFLSFLNEKSIDLSFFNAGRSALRAVLEHIERKCRNKVCLLPAYLCNSMILPFELQKWDCFFYTIDERLRPNIESISSLINSVNPSVIVLLPYYGEDTVSVVNDSLAEWRNRGGIIIEDLTQSLFLYDAHSSMYDYQIISIRKWLPIPDGAVAVGLKDRVNRSYDNDFVYLEREAQKLKERYLSGDDICKDVFLKMHRQAGEILSSSTEIYGMSIDSYNTMTVCDTISIENKRRRNISILKSSLKSEKIKPLIKDYSSLNAGIYFPVIVNNRSELQSYCQKKNVFCPVLWPKPQAVKLSDSVLDLLYDKVLCVPCDSRYGADEMEYVVKILNEY